MGRGGHGCATGPGPGSITTGTTRRSVSKRQPGKERNSPEGWEEARFFIILVCGGTGAQMQAPRSMNAAARVLPVQSQSCGQLTARSEVNNRVGIPGGVL
jgi:hypothetical protein